MEKKGRSSWVQPIRRSPVDTNSNKTRQNDNSDSPDGGNKLRELISRRKKIESEKPARPDLTQKQFGAVDEVQINRADETSTPSTKIPAINPESNLFKIVEKPARQRRHADLVNKRDATSSTPRPIREFTTLPDLDRGAILDSDLEDLLGDLNSLNSYAEEKSFDEIAPSPEETSGSLKGDFKNSYAEKKGFNEIIPSSDKTSDSLEDDLEKILKESESIDANTIVKQIEKKQAEANRRDNYGQAKSKTRTLNNAIVTTVKATKSHLQAILTKLPAGVKLDLNGNLSGTSELMKTPMHFLEGDNNVKAFPGLGLNFQEIFNERSNAALGQRLSSIKNTTQKVTLQGYSDLWRIDLELSGEKETFFSFKIPETTDNKRLVVIGNNLRAFCGSDEATTVLSSILHQSSPTTLSRSLSNSDGTALGHLRLISTRNTSEIDRQVYLLNADGSRQAIQDTRGLGAVKYKVSRQSEDFKLTMDWQAYYDQKPSSKEGNEAGLDEEHTLPLGEDDVIGVHFQAEIIVDGPMAHKREMKLSIPPGGIRTTFSGRLTME